MEKVPENPRPRLRKANSLKGVRVPGGYYLRQMRDFEPDELKAALTQGLEDEIAMMRVVIRHVFAAAQHADADLVGWSKTLGILGTASTRLARLLQIQKGLDKTEPGMNAALSQALSEVVEEMGLH